MSDVHTLHIYRIQKLVVNNVHTMNRVFNHFDLLCMLITRTGTPCKYDRLVFCIFRRYAYLHVVNNSITQCTRLYTTVGSALSGDTTHTCGGSEGEVERIWSENSEKWEQII